MNHMYKRCQEAASIGQFYLAREQSDPGIRPIDVEAETIRQFYSDWDCDSKYERLWGYINPVSGSYWRMRDELVTEAVTSRFDVLKQSVKVLEIGAGHGHELAKFSLLGIPQTNLTGVDLIPERIHRASETYPAIRFAYGDARELPFPDSSFDIICQFTCVMHAGSKESQRLICQEMARVLIPGGIIIWWDIIPPRWRNVFGRRLMQLLFEKLPLRQKAGLLCATFRDLFSSTRRRNAILAAIVPPVLPISTDELHAWFPGLKVYARPAGLDYPMWEAIWRRSPTVAHALWRTGWFSRHCFAVLEKRDLSGQYQSLQISRIHRAKTPR